MLASIIPETCGPFRVIWENADLSHQGFGQRYLMVVGMMKEMQQRFPDRFLDFRMTFSEPYFDEGQDPFLRPTRCSPPFSSPTGAKSRVGSSAPRAGSASAPSPSSPTQTGMRCLCGRRLWRPISGRSEERLGGKEGG